MENRLLSEEVYSDLLQKIVDGVWQVGDQIPSENQICRTYGVSRISARSAIQKLQAQNLLVTKPGRGSFVSSNHLGENIISLSVKKMDLTKDGYRCVIELRRAIEFASVDLMCQYGEAEDFERLEEALHEMIECGSDVGRYAAADFKFHLAIIKGSRNPLFESVVRGCQRELFMYFREMAQVSNGDFEKVIYNHMAIYQALLTREGEEVKRVIEETYEYNLRGFKDWFRGEAAKTSGCDHI